MSEEIKNLIAKLKAEVDRKCRAQHQALDELAAELLGQQPVASPSPAAAMSPKVRAWVEHESPTHAVPLKGESTVRQVLATIQNDFKSANAIAKELGISATKVRAALYSKFVKPRISTRVRDGATQFRVNPKAGAGKRTRAASDRTGPSAASRVRQALANHPRGLTAEQLNAELHAKTLREKKTIAASLYNMKGSDKVSHDTASGVYRLIGSNETANGQSA